MKTIKEDPPTTIDAIYQSTSIFISLDVSVESPGVLFNKSNTVFLDTDILFKSEKTPNEFKIVNKGSELKGKKLRLYSRYNVIAPTDDQVKHPKVTWKPNLEAGDHTLYDKVEETNSDDNMFEFILTFNF